MKTRYFIIVFLAIACVASGCKKKKEEDKVYYTSNFSVNGKVVQFKTTSTFGRFCIMTGVCNSFYLTPDGSLGTSFLSIGFPANVSTGCTYKNGDSNVQIVYGDGNGYRYFSNLWDNDTLLIHIDEWQGHGGWAQGTFSAKLRMDIAPFDTIYITNGIFSSRIWYYFQK